jgi:hypothetical protein
MTTDLQDAEVFTFDPLENGDIRVCLKINSVTACTYVTSMHLVEEKRSQLREACLRNVNP